MNVKFFVETPTFDQSCGITSIRVSFSSRASQTLDRNEGERISASISTTQLLRCEHLLLCRAVRTPYRYLVERRRQPLLLRVECDPRKELRSLVLGFVAQESYSPPLLVCKLRRVGSSALGI